MYLFMVYLYIYYEFVFSFHHHHLSAALPRSQSFTGNAMTDCTGECITMRKTLN